MSVLAVAIAGLGLAGAQVALTFYLVRWARGGEKKLRDGLRGSQKLKDRIAELDRAVEERDRALDNKVQEAARVAAPLGRVVALDASEGTRGFMEGLGLTVLMEEAGIVVGVKEPRETVPLTTLRVP